ncbi:ABC transporter permease [Neorhizobium sp. T6_25]|uniref:ABC transporter permease n=1 Tax=Neorhizobium sp. T6_25 TaxID=2093833 RepID=UPI000CF9F61A|nr:ABC transporter permease [Neorhizobium sp. T6_25]
MPTSLRRAQIAFCLLMMVFLIGPTFAVIPLSFSSASFLSYPLPGFSLQWYEKILQPQPWMSSLLNSLIIGLGATFVATIIGTLAALGLARGHLPARSTILAVVISPMIVPVVISGVGMYFFFAKLGLVASFSGLILAHAVLGVPFVVITVTATLKNLDACLVRAAASLGASPLHAFRTVTLPLIAPGVISGALFAFVFSFDEVVVALFISGPGQRTLPRQMFDGLRDNIDPSILAMSTLLVIISIVLMGGGALAQKRAAANRASVR